jgi:predicted Zn-ribbon and HTH transcriptional regulator
MPIFGEPLKATGLFETRQTAPSGHKIQMTQVYCPQCGFEPKGAVVGPKRCPKCHGSSWKREARPGMFLELIDRY